jgi:hypothetical protein
MPHYTIITPTTWHKVDDFLTDENFNDWTEEETEEWLFDKFSLEHIKGNLYEVRDAKLLTMFLLRWS